MNYLLVPSKILRSPVNYRLAHTPPCPLRRGHNPVYLDSLLLKSAKLYLPTLDPAHLVFSGHDENRPYARPAHQRIIYASLIESFPHPSYHVHLVVQRGGPKLTPVPSHLRRVADAGMIHKITLTVITIEHIKNKLYKLRLERGYLLYSKGLIPSCQR